MDIAALRDAYDEQGWVKLVGLVEGKDLERLREVISDANGRPEFKPKSTGIQSDQASREYEQTMRVLRQLWPAYPEVEALVCRLGSLVQDIAGWKSTRLWSDRVFTKPGRDFGSKPTIWHQDVKLPFDRRGFATVWIAIVDIPKTRGPMTFLNGSHRLGSLGAVSQLGEDRDLSEILDERDWALVKGCSTGAPLAAGDATMHGAYTLHRAGKNVDSEDRVVLAVSYFDAEQLYTGAANPVTDGLGLKPYQPFEHASFPIVA